jgi:60 kDa SS-A/Ro ribonucleoprotein
LAGCGASEPTALVKGSSPKLVCIDIQPYPTTQAIERDDIMNIGGFSDTVFARVCDFVAGDNQRFVAEVETMTI